MGAGVDWEELLFDTDCLDPADIAYALKDLCDTVLVE